MRRNLRSASCVLRVMRFGVTMRFMAKDPDTLASALNQCMAEKGWTQRELALQLGVDPSRISRVLTGKEGMAMTRVERLAQVLDRPEQEVAGLVWNARREPGQRPSTLGERVTALETELTEMRSEMAKLIETLEQAVGSKATGRKRTSR